MKSKRFAGLFALLLLSLLLTACGGSGETSSSGSAASMPDESAVSTMAPVEPEPEPEPESEPEPEPEPVLLYTNPLTGEPWATDISKNRPIAIMLNNLQKALPQLGVSQADIIYEIPAEGGITRMLAVFQSVEGVGDLGSVRSARDYYISLAYGHDALFLHAGGSPMAYSVIKEWGIPALDCVNGPYEGTLYWRDQERRKNMGKEHSVLTSGDTIQELLPTYYLRLEHKDSFSWPQEFLAEGETAQGEPANSVNIRFSEYKQRGRFDYDPETGLWLVSEYGDPYVDGNTGEQVAVKNVLVLNTDIKLIAGDEAGRQSVRTTGSGSGKFFCDGTVQDITWHKEKHSSPLTYTDANGQPLKLGVGKTYVNIIGSSAVVTVK